MNYKAENIVGHEILYHCQLSSTDYKALVVSAVDEQILQVQIEGASAADNTFRYINLGQIKEIYELPPMNL